MCFDELFGVMRLIFHLNGIETIVTPEFDIENASQSMKTHLIRSKVVIWYVFKFFYDMDLCVVLVYVVDNQAASKSMTCPV